MAAAPLHDKPSTESGIVAQPDTDPELVHPDKKYFCPVHRGLLRQPTQTPCGHRLCRSCLETYLNGETSKLCPVEDEDREEVSLYNVYPDPGILREINGQEVYCPLKKKGCKDTMKYKDMNNHVTKCQYRPVLCQYTLRGCQETPILRFKTDHEQSCAFQPVSCNGCGQEINVTDVEYHIDNNCPETVISCRYSCGAETKRSEMEDHSSVCTLKPKECQYKVLGCTYAGSEHDIAKHGKSMENHFEILVTFVCDMKMSLRNFFSSLHFELLIGLQEKIKTIETTVQKMEREFKEKDRTFLDRIAAVEHSMEEVREEKRLIVDDIRQLKENVNKMKEEISKYQKTASRDLAKYRVMEVKLAENDLRFQMIETTSYNGILLWKIRDFTIRRRDAVQGRTVSLYSQPFYSDRHGYKMCCRIYLNGDGIGKGSHISIYFVVMKGQYDALLEWPFQLPITMLVLDQSPQKNHIKECFSPDTTSTSFQRPNRAEMNVACGCPLFMAHSIIDDPINHYVKDETIFVMVTVNGSSIPPI